jgi:hypothetical protein
MIAGAKYYIKSDFNQMESELDLETLTLSSLRMFANTSTYCCRSCVSQVLRHKRSHW